MSGEWTAGAASNWIEKTCLVEITQGLNARVTASVIEKAKVVRGRVPGLPLLESLKRAVDNSA